MSTKSKSALPETPNSKTTPTTPRASRMSRGVAKSNADSPTPMQNAHLSDDRSPRSVTSKLTVERRSPRPSTPPGNKTTRILRPSELQAELSLAQEDMKKARAKLAFVEKEKSKAFIELKDAQRLAEEANEKLREACEAQKRAEENFEIEMFRAVEIEQVGIEEAEKKEEEWQKELDAVRKQHAVDVDALLSATQELQKAKNELAMTCDEKNQALSHADDAMRIAEIHAEKVEAISAELNHMKSLLDSKVETEANEKRRFVSELNTEIDSLRNELEKVKNIEEKLAEREATLEQLNIDMEAATLAESYTHNLVEELHLRVEELTHQAEQAKRMEKSVSESLESVSKQLEGSNVSLHDAESEVAALKEKVGLLEISIKEQAGDLEESERRIIVAKEEASEMAKAVGSLRSELETVKEEKIRSLNNEKLSASSGQTLLEEKNKLIYELETSRNEDEKSKKALESLASALHEVSSEARDTKEKLLFIQDEHEKYETQIAELNLVLKATSEKYESMLDDAKRDIGGLTSSSEQSKHDYQNLKSELEQKELHMTNSVKKSEENNSNMKNEISRLLNVLKMAEKETCAGREEEDRRKISFKETESGVIYLKEVVSEAKAESMQLKEGIMEKENELHDIHRENEELRKREAASLTKAEELSKLIEEALAKKQIDSKKDHHMVSNTVDVSEQNGIGDVKPKVESKEELPVNEKLGDVNDVPNDEVVQRAPEMENSDGKMKDNEQEDKDNEDSAEVGVTMSENRKTEEKGLSPEVEHEHESLEDELESKAEDGGSYDGVKEESSTENGGSSPSKQPDQKKKKKPLLRKFGSLLKKKSATNQKK